MIPIKTAREADKMRLSCRVASEVLDRVSELIRPGVTTKEIDEAAAEVRLAVEGERAGNGRRAVVVVLDQIQRVGARREHSRVERNIDGVEHRIGGRAEGGLGSVVPDTERHADMRPVEDDDATRRGGARE